jgi:demethylspheroidene O-methyltransferase
MVDHPMSAMPAGRLFAPLDRLIRWRDRLLASQRFQRWAAGFPLTRPIAQRRARALFDLCAGFVYSQILVACIRLHLFEILAEGPLSIAQLSRRLSLTPDAATRLLNAAKSLGLVERRGGYHFGLGPLGAALSGNPGIAAMIEHHHLLYDDLRDPVTLLRGAETQSALGIYWPYAGAASPAGFDPAQVAAYTALMSASQSFIADDVLEAYPFDRHRCLLDVGGGDGTFLAAVAVAAPELQLQLFDLPAVAEQARRRFAAAGLDGRASAIGGNFRTDDLPGGADLISLMRVAHDHDDAAVRRLLAAIHRALPEDGVLLISEPLSGTRGAEPVTEAYFGFYLLAMGSGRVRSAAEHESLLHEAGFTEVKTIRTRRPMLTSLLSARKGLNKVLL